MGRKTAAELKKGKAPIKTRRERMGKATKPKRDAAGKRVSRKGVRPFKESQPFCKLNSKLSLALLNHVNKTREAKDGKSNLGSGSGQGGVSKLDNTDNGLGNWISNPTSAGNEVILAVTDYFDSDPTAASQAYLVNVPSLPTISSVDGSSEAYGNRIKRVHVHALPRFEEDTATSSSLVMFAVPALRPITGDDSGKNYFAQDATLLTPTSVSNWVKVGSYDFDNLFGVTGYEPVYTNVNDTVKKSLLNVFEIQVLDPDDFTASKNAIQYRVDIEYAANVPLIQQVYQTVLSEATAWKGGVSVATEVKSYTNVLTNPKSVHNNM